MVDFLRKLKNLFIIHFFPQFTFRKTSEQKSYFLNIQKNLKKNIYPEIDNFINFNNYENVNLNWILELALKTQIVKKKSPVNIQHGRLLYSIVKKICEKNNNISILETGTARGFSSICMSKAIIDSKKNGKIMTIDFLPNTKKMYWNCISDLDGKKSRKELLKGYMLELENIDFIKGFSKKILKNLNINRINFAFLDGSHKYVDVKNEFNFVSNRQEKDDLIFFDDYTPGLFEGIVRLISEIESSGVYDVQKIFSSNNRGYVLARKI